MLLSISLETTSKKAICCNDRTTNDNSRIFLPPVPISFITVEKRHWDQYKTDCVQIKSPWRMGSFALTSNQSLNKYLLRIFLCAKHCDRLDFEVTMLKKKMTEFFLCPRRVHNLPTETRSLHVKNNMRQQNTDYHIIDIDNKHNTSSKGEGHVG